MGGTIGGLFLLVKGYVVSKSRGWRCGWEREKEISFLLITGRSREKPTI
jgi:hypothetical protein